MNLVERQAILRRWVMPSSDYEKDKQDRALRMVKSAIDAWPAFNGVACGFFTTEAGRVWSVQNFRR